jgi:hypothetical protein
MAVYHQNTKIYYSIVDTHETFENLPPIYNLHHSVSAKGVLATANSSTSRKCSVFLVRTLFRSAARTVGFEYDLEASLQSNRRIVDYFAMMPVMATC